MGHLHAPLHGSKALAWILGGQARQLNRRDPVEMIPSVNVWQQIYRLWGQISHLEIYQQRLVGPLKGLMGAGE